VRADPSTGDVVTLDLSDVEFIDSSGVSMLLIRSYLDGIGCRFALTNPQPQLCASSRSSASPRSSNRRRIGVKRTAPPAPSKGAGVPRGQAPPVSSMV
jgi:hypothetical protein